MILEACRLLADWLSDGTNGVNALLATTPLDAGDSTPASITTITDMTRDGESARKRLPTTLPGITVMAQGADGMAPHVTIADAESDLHIAIRLGFSNAQTDQAMRDSSYYLRTIVRSLRILNGNGDPTKRVRNQVYLESCVDMKVVPLWEDLGDRIVTGAVLLTYHVRDQFATT